MELYTTSSYNETMSGGGETLSSISEKSCISQNGNGSQHGGQQTMTNTGANQPNGILPLQNLHSLQNEFGAPLAYVVSPLLNTLHNYGCLKIIVHLH